MSQFLEQSISSQTTPNSTTSSTSLKRTASASFEAAQSDSTSRKRAKEDLDEPAMLPARSTTRDAFLEDIAQELQCGCCAELVYRPVIVSPCQHFFCGSCCALWFSNGGTNCPTCRAVLSKATPSRPLQSILEILLRADPSKTRAPREREQADEVYDAGSLLQAPTPRESSPAPNMSHTVDYARPCPHCQPDNMFGWWCPQPIIDPSVDLENAWSLEEGSPPGHAFCGNCESLVAIHAPSTMRCDFCLVLFCRIGVQGRCITAPVTSQHPHGMTDVADFIQSGEVYDSFEGNTVEVDFMLDYIVSQRLTPSQIYREIVTHIRSQPKGFAPLIEDDLFSDLHSVSPGVDANPQSLRENICRVCATQILLYGLKDWWIRERNKGFLEEGVASRKDCPGGSTCTRQKDLAHSREFNHIIVPATTLLETAIANTATEATTSGSGTDELVTSGTLLQCIPCIEFPSHGNFEETSSLSLPQHDVVDTV